MQASLPLPIFFFTLAASAPILLEDADKKGSMSPPPWQGPAFAAATLCATFNARNAVYEVLHLALGVRPSEGLLVKPVGAYISCCPTRTHQATGK